MLLGPVKLLGETDKISSGSDKDGGKIAIGLETMVNDTIVKGEEPDSWAGFKQTLNN